MHVLPTAHCFVKSSKPLNCLNQLDQTVLFPTISCMFFSAVLWVITNWSVESPKHNSMLLVLASYWYNIASLLDFWFWHSLCTRCRFSSFTSFAVGALSHLHYFSIAAQVEDILTRMIMRVMIMLMLMSMHMHTHCKIYLWVCLYYVSISYTFMSNSVLIWTFLLYRDAFFDSVAADCCF